MQAFLFILFVVLAVVSFVLFFYLNSDCPYDDEGFIFTLTAVAALAAAVCLIWCCNYDENPKTPRVEGSENFDSFYYSCKPKERSWYDHFEDVNRANSLYMNDELFALRMKVYNTRLGLEKNAPDRSFADAIPEVKAIFNKSVTAMTDAQIKDGFAYEAIYIEDHYKPDRVDIKPERDKAMEIHENTMMKERMNLEIAMIQAEKEKRVKQILGGSKPVQSASVNDRLAKILKSLKDTDNGCNGLEKEIGDNIVRLFQEGATDELLLSFEKKLGDCLIIEIANQAK